MKVKILAHTPNPENLIANAGRLCYSNMDIEDLFLFNNYTDEQNEKMINNLVSLGHESPLEHISFTFGVEGVSRALTHQLVRHRIANFSQQSQRYVKLDQFEYVMPPEIERNNKSRKLFTEKMKLDQLHYDLIVSDLMKNGRTEKEAIEDARYVFPNACKTKIVFTMNARTLLNFFKLRTCNRSQWEIRELADEMLRQVKEIAPSVFSKAGAGCVRGKCPEGKMTCGNPRSLEEDD